MKQIITIIIFFGLITSSFAEKKSFFDEAKILFEEEKYEESKFLFQRNIVYQIMIFNCLLRDAFNKN